MSVKLEKSIQKGISPTEMRQHVSASTSVREAHKRGVNASVPRAYTVLKDARQRVDSQMHKRVDAQTSGRILSQKEKVIQYTLFDAGHWLPGGQL